MYLIARAVYHGMLFTDPTIFPGNIKLSQTNADHTFQLLRRRTDCKRGRMQGVRQRTRKGVGVESVLGTCSSGSLGRALGLGGGGGIGLGAGTATGTPRALTA